MNDALSASLEWPALIFSTIGVTLIAFNTPFNLLAFILMFIGSMLWLIRAIIHKDRVMTLQWLFYFVLNLIGMYRWS